MSRRAIAIALAAVAAVILYRLRREAFVPAPPSDRAEPAQGEARPEPAAPAESLTRAELYREARRLGLPGRSSMNKAELARTIEAANRPGGAAG